MESTIKEWVIDFKEFNGKDISSYAASIDDVDLLNVLFDCFEDKVSFIEHGDTICNQLFQYYRSDHLELRRFVLQFVPSLMYFYLNAVATGERELFKYVEVLLLGIYNFEVTDNEGNPKVVNFKVPSLAQNSSYHEPLSFQSTALTESALKRFEQGQQVSWGPLKTLHSFTAHNRLLSLAALLVIFNRNIGHFNKICLLRTCLVTSLLTSQGYHKSLTDLKRKSQSTTSIDDYLSDLRITLSPELMLELLQSIYYIISNSHCMNDDSQIQYPFLSITSCNSRYNDYTTVAIKALEDILFRSHVEMLPDVSMVASAMMNSVKLSKTGQLYSVGIPSSSSIHVTPSNKTLITNASFRIKKLPDDIPIQTPEDPKTGKVLSSITEEDSEINISKPKVRDKLALLKKKTEGKLRDFDDKERKVKESLADKFRPKKDHKVNTSDDIELRPVDSDISNNDLKGHTRHHSSGSMVKVHEDNRTFSGNSSLSSVGSELNREHINGMNVDS